MLLLGRFPTLHQTGPVAEEAKLDERLGPLGWPQRGRALATDRDSLRLIVDQLEENPLVRQLQQSHESHLFHGFRVYSAKRMFGA